MENLGLKVGFLKGLMAGDRAFDRESTEGKLFEGIVELLGSLTERVEAADELLQDLNDYVESIDDDLTVIEGDRPDSEDDFFDDIDDDDDMEDFDDLFDEGEDRLHLLHTLEKDGEDETLAARLCPKCSRVFFTSLKAPEGAAYVCPHCGERVTPLPITTGNAPTAQPAEDQKQPR